MSVSLFESRAKDANASLAPFCVLHVTPTYQVPHCLILVIRLLAVSMLYDITNTGDRYGEVGIIVFEVCPYTGCPRRNVPDIGRVFLILKYTDITQNTYVQS